MDTAVFRRTWFPPAVMVGLGALAAGFYAAVALAEVPCPHCRVLLVVHAIAFPLALAGFLAVIAGASDMAVRRLLMVAGLAFALCFFLAVVPPSAVREAGQACAAGTPCGDGPFGLLLRHHALLSASVSLLVAAAAFWGAFRPHAEASQGLEPPG